MRVSRTAGARSAAHADTTYYFCSEGCRNKFRADPGRYVTSPEAPVSANALARTKWTCPMHPKIVRDGPGHCPICGMALEPMIPSATAQPNSELREM